MLKTTTKAIIVSLVLSLAYIGAALAQSVNGSASLSASTSSSQVAIPNISTQYQALMVVPVPGGAEVFYRFGTDNTVVAATTDLALPSGGLCVSNIGPAKNLAVITATGSATVRLTKLNSCSQFAAIGSSSGSSVVITGSPSFGPVAPAAPTATNSDLMGCRYNSTANDTVANDQGAVGCDQRGGIYVQDGQQISPVTLTGTGPLFTVSNTSGYGSISLQVTSAGVATIQYEASEDGITWNNVGGFGPSYSGSGAIQTSSTTTGILWFSLTAKQFRARVSSYVSGNVTIQGTLRKDPLPRQSVQVGFLSSANNVGGYGADLTACNSGCTINTLTIAASSHTSGSSLGGLQTFAFFRTTGNSGIINQVDWKWRTGTNLTPVTVYLFNAAPTGCTDGSSFSVAAADVPKLVKGSPFVLNPAVIGTGSAFSVDRLVQALTVNNTESTTSLYACVTTNVTITPAANDGVLGVSGLQN